MKILTFSPEGSRDYEELKKAIELIISNASEMVENCKIEEDEDIVPEGPPNAYLVKEKRPKWKKKLTSALNDFKLHLDMLG